MARQAPFEDKSGNRLLIRRAGFETLAAHTDDARRAWILFGFQPAGLWIFDHFFYAKSVTRCENRPQCAFDVQMLAVAWLSVISCANCFNPTTVIAPATKR
jgi:hypothetical protein